MIRCLGPQIQFQGGNFFEPDGPDQPFRWYSATDSSLALSQALGLGPYLKNHPTTYLQAYDSYCDVSKQKKKKKTNKQKKKNKKKNKKEKQNVKKKILKKKNAKKENLLVERGGI